MPSTHIPGPQVALSIDMHAMESHFPPGRILDNGDSGRLLIDKQKFEKVAALANSFKLPDKGLIHNFAYILLWIEAEVITAADNGNAGSQFNKMWTELEKLRDYLLTHRITSVKLQGEVKRDQPGKPFVMTEEINIDRLCDAIRTAYRDEFNHDRNNGTGKGKRAWQKRKLVKVRNRFMNYLAAVPELDSLSLEQQSRLFNGLTAIAGLSR
jgi:hypothetical protein